MTKLIPSFARERRFWAILTGILETFLVCHGIEAFSSLEYVLRRENYFSDLSEEEKAQTYSRLFSAIVISTNICKLSISFLNDTFGLWIARSIGSLRMHGMPREHARLVFKPFVW